MARSFVTLESIACRIAAAAGVSWRDLPDHPGFSKGRWRDDARWLIRRSTPHAVFIDGQPLWNGKMTDDLVANLTDDDVIRAIDASRKACR